ncbi:MAG TPA: TIGR01777 family oxidoreductase [Thermoanaerobaculia bacterium]
MIARGHDVAVLTRNPAKVRSGRAVPWSSVASEVAGAAVVINLAGENVGAGRWTAERKRRIVDSRVGSTRELVEAMRDNPPQRRTFISASAVGYYGLRGDELLDESAPAGEGFLADVVRQWEEAARGAEKIARVVLLRFGVVLASEGGALQKMMLPFRLGVGGPIGSGRQWMSWVDREDVLRAMEWAIDRPEVRGVYNITAPNPVINRDFARALGRALRRPAVLPTPAFALRLIFGQMADEMLLSGQRVAPARATIEGFAFEYPTIDAALRHVSAR